MRHVPCAMCPVPCAMCHVPCAMCHVPCVVCHVWLQSCLSSTLHVTATVTHGDCHGATSNVYESCCAVITARSPLPPRPLPLHSSLFHLSSQQSSARTFSRQLPRHPLPPPPPTLEPCCHPSWPSSRCALRCAALRCIAFLCFALQRTEC